MTAVESLKQNILAECDDDHVGLWSVIRDVEEALPKLGQAAIRDHVLGVLRELLVAQEIKAGYPTATGGFRSLRATPDKILAQIEADWPVGHRPTIGEGPWFTKANKRNPLVDLLETVKNDKESGKYPVKINPRKYGFNTEDEYWRRVRELAGLPARKTS
ncbi:MAG TPA: hypothetical protein VMV10_02080 [Pirellulales bacterium]|nr:hypothetical protein [Pirellulales bacterium]